MISFTKVVHMVIAVALTFISLAGLYVILEAEFVAFVQVLIYAGAISILMIFGIMMTKHRQGKKRSLSVRGMKAWLLLVLWDCSAILFYAIQKTTFVASGTLDAGKDNTLKSESCSITCTSFLSKSCPCC